MLRIFVSNGSTDPIACLTNGKIRTLHDKNGKAFGILCVHQNLFVSFRYSRRMVHLKWILAALFGPIVPEAK